MYYIIIIIYFVLAEFSQEDTISLDNISDNRSLIGQTQNLEYTLF